MSEQVSLFGPRGAYRRRYFTTHKTQPATAIDAYRAITPTLTKREQVVLDALRDCGAWHPTAYELVRVMAKAGAIAREDVNLVRPRLSEMWGRQDARLVQCESRRCTVTGRPAMTWAVK